jgi:hypothetical protein
MSGLSNILRTFFDLLAAAGLDLSIRQRVGMVAILVVLLAPALLRSVGVSQARSRVMATRLLDGPARQEAEDQALAAARGKARQLVAVAETALSLGRSRLAAAAVEALAETGEEKESLRALRRKMAPVVPLQSDCRQTPTRSTAVVAAATPAKPRTGWPKSAAAPAQRSRPLPPATPSVDCRPALVFAAAHSCRWNRAAPQSDYPSESTSATQAQSLPPPPR